ncbi:MAG: AAA family ATPase, partial [Desulfobulbaceae bacterium]|nr:AAA family ATPase [Desulfobulbaceae bacterium]
MAQETDQNIFVRFDRLRDSLKQIIFDQDKAIDEVVDAFIHMAYKPVDTPPKAIFTFLGPPSVGKKSLARALTSHLEEYAAFKQFDMEQFTDPESAAQLFGQRFTADDGVQEGELTDFIKEHPQSIILFDSIEKADNQLQSGLFNLLTRSEEESGINCSGVIVIFTSSLGCSFFKDRKYQETFKENKLRAQALVMDALSKERKAVYDTVQSAIAPKMLAAMARNFIILFNSLSLDTLVRIGGESLSGHSRQFADVSGMKVEYHDFDRIATLLTLSFSPNISVNRLKQKLPDLFLGRITRFVRDQRKYPQHIVCRLSKQADSFLEKICQDKETLLDRLYKKNETVDISWKETLRGQKLTCAIHKAELKRLPPSSEFFRELMPGVEFSTLGFKDIAGNKSTKKNLKQIVKILREPELLKKFGI